MIIGDPSNVAIESCLTRRLELPSQRGVGYFLIHVSGKSYGVKSPEATVLACSFDAVVRRRSGRGAHSASFGSTETGIAIASAYFRANYLEKDPGWRVFGIDVDGFLKFMADQEIVWAPDGDEAFDDG